MIGVMLSISLLFARMNQLALPVTLIFLSF